MIEVAIWIKTNFSHCFSFIQIKTVHLMGSQDVIPVNIFNIL